MPRRNKSVPSPKADRYSGALELRADTPLDNLGSASTSITGKRDWYNERRSNRRVMRNRALRQAKYLKPGGSFSELVTYDTGTFKEEGLTSGIVAEFNPPKLSILSDGSMLQVTITSKEERFILNQLAVGDDVVFRASEANVISLKGILERRSKLVRLRLDASRVSMASAEEQVIAANIDMALIVVSVARPPFHSKLIDRYLVMCQYGNVKPSICLTKTDLGHKPDLSVYRSLGLAVFEVSNTTHNGIEALAKHLRGKRCVLVGHSGVGKSSLVNNLLEKEIMPVGSVGQKSRKGKHTTSSSSLHVISPNTFLIDTPGIRSLGLWNVDRFSLRLYFPEFDSFAGSCQYKDCSHSHEPDCGVKKAVEGGEIARERYDSYIRLLEEQE